MRKFPDLSNNLKLLNFKNFFIGSRSCPNQTKLGMECPLCTYSLKEKNCYSLPKKVSISYGKLHISRITNFKNRSFSPGQGDVQSEPDDIPTYQYYLGCNAKRLVGQLFLAKNFVFQSEITTYSLIIRLFYFQKYRNFSGSRSSPNQTKLGMENPRCT